MSQEHCPKCLGTNGFCSRCRTPRSKGVGCRNKCRNAKWVPCEPHQTSIWTCDCCQAVLAPPQTVHWASWPWTQVHRRAPDEYEFLCNTCFEYWCELQETAATVIWDRLHMDRAQKNVGQVFTDRENAAPK